MSRIFEAIRRAEASRSKGESLDGGGLGVMEMPDRRLGPRWELGIHITVYGRALDESPFYEEVKAFSVGADSGLLVLSLPVSDGQDLLLINNRTSQELICRVVGSRIRDIRTSEIAVSFPSPNPEFWLTPEIPVELSRV